MPQGIRRTAGADVIETSDNRSHPGGDLVAFAGLLLKTGGGYVDMAEAVEAERRIPERVRRLVHAKGGQTCEGDATQATLARQRSERNDRVRVEEGGSSSFAGNMGDELGPVILHARQGRHRGTPAADHVVEGAGVGKPSVELSESHKPAPLREGLRRHEASHEPVQSVDVANHFHLLAECPEDPRALVHRPADLLPTSVAPDMIIMPLCELGPALFMREETAVLEVQHVCLLR
jgi:hypothetical protein